MKFKGKSKDYKISVVFYIVCLVWFGISLVTGLMPGIIYPIDTTCMFLGFAFMGLGTLFYFKDIRNNDNRDQ